ncbi:hypothetical protein H4S07_001618, partial [Coemansia furcata]
IPVLREKKKNIKGFNEDVDYYKYDLSFNEDESAKEDEHTKEAENDKENGWQVYHINDVNNGDDEYDEYYMDDVSYIKENVSGHDDAWSSPNEYIVDFNCDPWYGEFVNNYLCVHLHNDGSNGEDGLKDEDKPSGKVKPSGEDGPCDDDGPLDEDILMEPFMDMNCDL